LPPRPPPPTPSPYTTLFRSPIELTLDHTGPIARTAADCALLLEAIAGPDGLDPRQSGGVRTEPYTRMLTGDARGLRLGIVREGLDRKSTRLNSSHVSISYAV